MMIDHRALHGLGAVDCPPPALSNPGYYVTDPLAFNSYQSNCAGVTGNAIITNNNLYAEWKLNASNAALNGQPPPPCPAYQQPNCAAIQQSLTQSAVSNTPVDSSNWVTSVQSSPVGKSSGGINPSAALLNAQTLVPANPPASSVPQPTPSSNAPSIVPAAAVTPPILPTLAPGTIAPVPVIASAPSLLQASQTTSSTLFGLPTWVVLGAAAVGAFLIFGGHR